MCQCKEGPLGWECQDYSSSLISVPSPTQPPLCWLWESILTKAITVRDRSVSFASVLILLSWDGNLYSDFFFFFTCLFVFPFNISVDVLNMRKKNLCIQIMNKYFLFHTPQWLSQTVLLLVQWCQWPPPLITTICLPSPAGDGSILRPLGSAPVLPPSPSRQTGINGARWVDNEAPRHRITPVGEW